LKIEYLQISGRNTSYAYATGRIRGLEKQLLKEGDFARIKEAEGLREALQILSKTFPYSESMKKVEKDEEFEIGLEEELKRTYEDLRSFCPEPDLVDLFWFEYDFHNLKVLFRIYLQGKTSEPGKDLFISGTQDPQVLEEALRTRNFTALSPEFQGLLKESLSFVKENSHPQDVDSFLDRRLFKWLSFKVRNYSDPFLDELLQIKIDRFNLLSFLRIKFWKVSDEKKLLDRTLVDGGMVKRERLLKLAGGSEELLARELENTDYGRAVEEVLKEEAQDSLISLDKFFDEYILRHTKRGSYVTFGREPLVNYILLKKREIKNLRRILRGKMAGLSQSQIERYAYA